MVYLDLVAGLNFAVDFLLLLGTNRLAGYPVKLRRCLAAAAVGGIYGGTCLLPGFSFLGQTLWRLVFLGILSGIAFGLNRSALRRGILFVLLSMALGGIALGFGRGGSWQLLAAAAGICLVCLLGFGAQAGQTFLTVEIIHGGKQVSTTALRDTGNGLRDPITGDSVLVAGPDLAWDLLKLTPEQLASPIESFTAVAGLRLIPYRAVGTGSGMLLAIRPEELRLDGKISRAMVAFAPDPIGNEAYQALAGGIL